MPIKIFFPTPNSQVARMFYNRSKVFQGVLKIEEADIIVWTGGHDVHPTWYGEKPIEGTYTNEERDNRDIDAYMAAREDQLKVGICRGAQLLNIMNDGKLWQDIDEHGRAHLVVDHKSGKSIWVSSTHHQQMRPGPYAEVLATTRLAGQKRSENESWNRFDPVTGKSVETTIKKPGTNHLIVDPNAIDYEVLWYPNSSCLCFQPHPEMTYYKACEEYFFELLFTYFIQINPKKVA